MERWKLRQREKGLGKASPHKHVCLMRECKTSEQSSLVLKCQPSEGRLLVVVRLFYINLVCVVFLEVEQLWPHVTFFVSIWLDILGLGSPGIYCTSTSWNRLPSGQLWPALACLISTKHIFPLSTVFTLDSGPDLVPSFLSGSARWLSSNKTTWTNSLRRLESKTFSRPWTLKLSDLSAVRIRHYDFYILNSHSIFISQRWHFDFI